MFKKLMFGCALLTFATQLSAADIVNPAVIEPTATEAIVIETPQQLNATIDNYMYKKNPNDVKAILNFISNGDTLDGEALFPMIGFMIGIKKDNPSFFEELKQQSYPTKIKELISQADGSLATIEKFLDGKEMTYKEENATLAVLWGYFRSTGDKRVPESMCKMEKTTTSAIFRFRVLYMFENNRVKYPDLIEDCFQ